MEVYSSRFVKFIFDEGASTLNVLWSKDTVRMLDHEFREELIKYSETVEEYRPIRSFVDTQMFFLTVVPDTQEWVHQVIHQRNLEAGVTKFAYLISEDLFSQISIEQTLEEGNTQEVFEIRYFDNEEKARDWLKLEKVVKLKKEETPQAELQSQNENANQEDIKEANEVQNQDEPKNENGLTDIA